jgi:hypothetical protein
MHGPCRAFSCTDWVTYRQRVGLDEQIAAGGQVGGVMWAYRRWQQDTFRAAMKE